MMQAPLREKAVYQIVWTKTGQVLSVLDVGNTQKCGIGLLPGNSNSPSTLWLLEAHGNLFGIIHGMSDMMLAVHKLSMVMRSTWEHHQIFHIGMNEKGLCSISVPNASNLSGRCCEVVDGELVMVKSQKFEWEFRIVGGNQFVSRSCFIECSKTGNMIDVPHGEDRQGAQLLVVKPNYRFNQRWVLYKAGQVFIIKSFLTRLNMDVENNNFVNGGRVLQWHTHGGSNQFWRVDMLNEQNKSYKIYSWYTPQYSLYNDNGRLIVSKDRQTEWIIEGYVPQ